MKKQLLAILMVLLVANVAGLLQSCGDNTRVQTEISILDSAVTQQQADSTLSLLKRRLAEKKIPYYNSSIDLKSKSILLETGSLESELVKPLLYQGTQLEFYECYSFQEIQPELLKAVNIEEIRGIIKFSTGEDNRFGNVGFIGSCKPDQEDLAYIICEKLAEGLPEKTRIMLQDEGIIEKTGKARSVLIYMLKDNYNKFEATNDIVEVRDERSGNSRPNENLLYIKLNAAGATKFKDITSRNVSKAIGIVINNQLFSAPIVYEPIVNGELRIVGAPSGKSGSIANKLASELRWGRLPLRLEFKGSKPIKDISK